MNEKSTLKGPNIFVAGVAQPLSGGIIAQQTLQIMTKAHETGHEI